MIVKSKHGHDVTVNHAIAEHVEGQHVITLNVECGQTRKVKNITLGAVDGPRPDVPIADLPNIIQKELDEHRQNLADDTSWREHVRLATKNLK